MFAIFTTVNQLCFEYKIRKIIKDLHVKRDPKRKRISKDIKDIVDVIDDLIM